MPRAARFDKLGRQGLGFPWFDHRTIGEADEQARLEHLHHTVGITPPQFSRLRSLLCREVAPVQYRDAEGRFA